MRKEIYKKPSECTTVEYIKNIFHWTLILKFLNQDGNRTLIRPFLCWRDPESQKVEFYLLKVGF